MSLKFTDGSEVTQDMNMTMLAIFGVNNHQNPPQY